MGAADAGAVLACPGETVVTGSVGEHARVAAVGKSIEGGGGNGAVPSRAAAATRSVPKTRYGDVHPSVASAQSTGRARAATGARPTDSSISATARAGRASVVVREFRTQAVPVVDAGLAGQRAGACAGAWVHAGAVREADHRPAAHLLARATGGFRLGLTNAEAIRPGHTLLTRGTIAGYDTLLVAGRELARERTIAVAVMDALAAQVEFLGTPAARSSHDGSQTDTYEQTGSIHFILQRLVRWLSVPQKGITNASKRFRRMQRSLRLLAREERRLVVQKSGIRTRTAVSGHVHNRYQPRAPGLDRMACCLQSAWSMRNRLRPSYTLTWLGYPSHCPSGQPGAFLALVSKIGKTTVPGPPSRAASSAKLAPAVRWLYPVLDGRVSPIPKGTTTLGRDEACDIRDHSSFEAVFERRRTLPGRIRNASARPRTGRRSAAGRLLAPFSGP